MFEYIFTDGIPRYLLQLDGCQYCFAGLDLMSLYFLTNIRTNCCCKMHVRHQSLNMSFWVYFTFLNVNVDVMYLRPYFKFLYRTSKQTLLFAVRAALTVDEDKSRVKHCNGTWPRVASLCPCHVRLRRVPRVPGLQWTGQDSGALSHLMFCHTRLQVSVTAHRGGPSEWEVSFCCTEL